MMHARGKIYRNADLDCHLKYYWLSDKLWGRGLYARTCIARLVGHRLKAGPFSSMSLFGNFESLVWLTRFLVSLGMTEERLFALSRFKWVAVLSVIKLAHHANFISCYHINSFALQF